MKVILVSGIYPPEIGGPAVFIPDFAKYLLQEGIECEVLTLRDPNIPMPCSQWKVNSVVRTNYFMRCVKIIFKLYQSRERDSIFFANGLIEETGIFLYLFKQSGVAKVVGDPVWERARNNAQTFDNINEFNLQVGSICQKFQRKILVFALNQFTLITCPSEELKCIVENWGVSVPIRVIPNGVEISPQILGAVKDIDVITVSRLVNWKNLDFVIQACGVLKANLWVVGNGPQRQYLNNLAESMGVEATFTGNLIQSEVVEILKRAKVFVLFSDYEGLSFALLEALANGAVPLVSNCVGNTAVINHAENGLVTPLKDLGSLCNSLSRLLNDDTLRQEMEVNGRKTIVSMYNLNDKFNEYLTLMNDLT